VLSPTQQCIFDGYILSWRLHFDRATTASTLEVWAQDASWLMNLDDKVHEWPGYTNGQVANEIFSSYRFATDAANTDSDSPSHQTAEHSLFQRATDLQFLRGLARRDGRVCRVSCTDRPGTRTGYFARPSVEVPPAAVITLLDPDRWNVDILDLDWDVMRPTEVKSSQVSITNPDDNSVSGDAQSSGLRTLDAIDLATYATRSSSQRLTATADVAELSQRTAAVLAESGWFMRCQGESNAERLGTILRAGSVAEVDGAGSLHSGNWYVWSVHHRVTTNDYRMRFTLVRNAVGASASSPGGNGVLGG
jgi:hypothetical protein